MNGEKLQTVLVRDVLGSMTVADLVAHAAERRVEEIRRYHKALRRKARQVAKLRALVASWEAVARRNGWPQPVTIIPAIMSDAPVDKSEAQVTHWEAPTSEPK